jgi:hypothetical protein
MFAEWMLTSFGLALLIVAALAVPQDAFADEWSDCEKQCADAGFEKYTLDWSVCMDTCLQGKGCDNIDNRCEFEIALPKACRRGMKASECKDFGCNTELFD